jgi:hypothetical protein
MIMREWDAPEGHSGHCCVHLYAVVSYQRLSPQFQFSLSAFTLGIYLSGNSRQKETGMSDVTNPESLRIPKVYTCCPGWPSWGS